MPISVELDGATAPDFSSQAVTPESIRPYPKAPARKSTVRRKLGKSRVVTDTPEKEAIEQEQLARKRKCRPAAPRGRTKRQVLQSEAGADNIATSTKSSNSTHHQKRKQSSDAPCLYCGELWSASREAFIRCQGKCQEWAHVSCAGVSSKDKNFVCERC